MLTKVGCPGTSETVKPIHECSFSLMTGGRRYSGIFLCRGHKQSSLCLSLSHIHILQALMHCSHTTTQWEGVGRWPLHCESFGLSSIRGFNSSVLIGPLSLYRDQSCTCPLWPAAAMSFMLAPAVRLYTNKSEIGRVLTCKALMLIDNVAQSDSLRNTSRFKHP